MADPKPTDPLTGWDIKRMVDGSIEAHWGHDGTIIEISKAGNFHEVHGWGSGFPPAESVAAVIALWREVK
jgi:hypothetical protein